MRALTLPIFALLVASTTVLARQMIEGPHVIGGECPAGTYNYFDKNTRVHRCCCRWFCCLNGCQTAKVPTPPEKCLENIPGGAEWILNEETGNYQAWTLGEWVFMLR